MPVTRTFSGEELEMMYALPPKQIHIEDIAHSLSRQCILGGHMEGEAVSYAQYACMVSDCIVRKALGSGEVPELDREAKRKAYYALLHWASQSLLCGPFRMYANAMSMSMSALEKEVEQSILHRFGVSYEEYREYREPVKEAEEVVYRTIMRDLFAPVRSKREEPQLARRRRTLQTSLPWRVESWGCGDLAKSQYLIRFWDRGDVDKFSLLKPSGRSDFVTALIEEWYPEVAAAHRYAKRPGRLAAKRKRQRKAALQEPSP